MQSIDVHTGPFVDKVLVDAPGENVSEPLAHYAGCKTTKVANKPVMFIYLEECLTDALVVLSLIFIVKLEEHPRADDI